MSSSTCVTLVVLLLFPASLRAQDFSPVAVGSVHDEPTDGQGDSLNPPPFEGLVLQAGSVEDRAIQEFDVTALAGETVSSATLSGRISANNSLDVGPRQFLFELFEGDGVVQVTDFEIPSLHVGTDTYAPPADSVLDYSIDVTIWVQMLSSGGASYIGLRVDPLTSPNAANILSESRSLLSITTAVGGVLSFCSGDGSGASCPCGNAGVVGRGCANSASSDGARLAATGSISVSGGDCVLQGDTLPPGQPGLFFQGDAAVAGGAGLPFGDGLRCVGTNVVRLQTVAANPSGVASTSVDVAASGGVSAGDVKNYQLWYRDPVGGPCDSGFNLSQGYEIEWLP